MRINLTIIVLLMTLLQVSAGGYGQVINLNKTEASLQTVIREIRKQSGYDFIYASPGMKQALPVTINISNGSLPEALKLVFQNQPLSFYIKDKTIFITEKRNELYRRQPVQGTILDENEKPVAGASIRVVGKSAQSRSRVAVSNKDGRFMLGVGPDDTHLEVSYIGYKTQQIAIKSIKTPLVIRMQIAEHQMHDVVITGTGITRNKNSFTGATASYTGEQLKSVNNNNIIQSLRTLDPSFIQLENNLAGANPNALPVIEVRGKTSVPTASLRDQFATDPNQPLFILDGFETTLQTIVDLDINRIASATILKDAASTALYGARASNGVVVIETIKPKSGELQFTYSNDFRVEAPLLSVYNMMNASEKLLFEELSGRYISTSATPTAQVELDQLYYDHLKAVREGVDTYWLNEPVQTGLSENNSIYAQGGDGHLTYGVGVNYKMHSGAMKGSGRDTWSGSANLTYRSKKLDVNNILFVRGHNATVSPYGSFSNFVNASPYFRKNATERYLEVTRTARGGEIKIRNPLFDASLPNTETEKNIEVQNNLQVNYSFMPELRLTAGLQLIKGSIEEEVFRAPEHSAFEELPVLRKGKYTNLKRDNFSYQANALLTFGKVFAQKHSFTANARMEVNNRENRFLSFAAEGFPEGTTGNPRFAYSYQTNSAPDASSRVYRTASATGSVNYAFDQRFLADASYRLDGSTAFGSNKQFSPYWSAGLGWNIHREKFAGQSEWLNRLRLYANIGVTGNQNYGNVTSVSTYDYNSNTNYNQFGQGVTLSTLGNPDLAPQKTTQISGGLDFSLFQNRLSGYINLYNKYTNPLVVAVDLASSTGLVAYPFNVGTMNTLGTEFKVGYTVVSNLEKRIVWGINLTGGALKSKYANFGNALEGLNKQNERSQTISTALLRYKDGYSPDDIWAAPSLGIDPGTGREMFLRPDGQYTYEYSSANLEAVGNTNPTVEGVASTYLSFKGFTVGVNLRYQFGGDIFNTALYNKVENISYTSLGNNQDKRALYDRWKSPGDITSFKAISQTSTTPQSSRFVQENNTITGESISLGYVFDRQPWLKKYGMKTLSLTAIGNDIFQASTVFRERGIDYPFAKTVSFSLRASF